MGAVKNKKNRAGRTGIVKEEAESSPDIDKSLYEDWLIEDEMNTGKIKPRRAKRSMKDLRGFKKSGPPKKISHSRMTSSKAKGDKKDQWTKYYK